MAMNPLPSDYGQGKGCSAKQAAEHNADCWSRRCPLFPYRVDFLVMLLQDLAEPRDVEVYVAFQVCQLQSRPSGAQLIRKGWRTQQICMCSRWSNGTWLRDGKKTLTPLAIPKRSAGCPACQARPTSQAVDAADPRFL